MKQYHTLVILSAVLLGGCRTSAPTAVPQLEIEVSGVRVDSIAERMGFIGYLDGKTEAVIQPRVNGFIISKHYESGMPVRRGDLLFSMDPSQLSTSVLAAEAALESALAEESQARSNFERAEPLVRIDAISAVQFDQYTARYKAAQSAVRSAREALRNARINLSYTKIFSPIDGIAGSSSAAEGDYVGPGTQFTVLTQISDTDTMSVDVSIPMSRYLRIVGDASQIYDNRTLLSDIRLRLSDGVLYPLCGEYDYTRKNISTTSGTITLVVLFANPEGRLKPGQFAHIEANVGRANPALLVPQQSVTQMQGGASVWVVAADSTVHYRRVTTGATYGGEWRITDGLAEGETVVAGGGAKLREGQKIIPRKVE